MVSRESKSGISCVKASVFIVTFRSAKILGNSTDAIDVKISQPPNLNTLISRESKSSISYVATSVFIVTFWSAKIPGNSSDAIDVKIPPPPDLNTSIFFLLCFIYLTYILGLIFKHSVSLQDYK